jgi:3-phenylpropionate/trans-cinnamate dioxygenase ferredoxin subunit
MARHVVATTAEIPPGTRKLVTVRGRRIGIFNLNGAYFGLFDRCPHQGGSLCLGITTGFVESDEPGSYTYTRRGEILRCPWHGWEFDIRTGQSVTDPDGIRTRSYKVEVAQGGEVLERQLAAETVPVSIEENYVVVDV